MRTTRTIASLLPALRRLRRRECWTRARIDTFQASAFAGLRVHAYAHSPFYREFHAGRAGAPLCELPVLTTAALHEHFDEIVTDARVRHADVAAHAQTIQGNERYLGQYVAVASSGTMGDATHLLYNRAEWATVLASFARYERHVGTLRGTMTRPRMAIVASSTPWHMSARVGSTVRSAWLPMLRLDVGEPIATIVAKLNDWQPQILATYASMAGILAHEQASGRLRISPRRIVCTAEVLSASLRARAEAAWGEIVFDQYGATEGGAFAMQCSRGNGIFRGEESPGQPKRGLHLFEDLYIVENVDQQNRPVPAGVYGDKILLTVLFNRTLPLIRYELHDSLCMAAAPCPCGCAFSVIEDVQGRSEDILTLPTQDGSTVKIHPMIFYRILDASPVRGWHVRQGADTLTLHLNGDPGAVDVHALQDEVARALGRQHAIVPQIHVAWDDDPRRGATGKAKRITSLHA